MFDEMSEPPAKIIRLDRYLQSLFYLNSIFNSKITMSKLQNNNDFFAKSDGYFLGQSTIMAKLWNFT